MTELVLPQAAPSAHGVDARGVLAFVDAVEREGIELHSLMVARHGHVVAAGSWAPYRLDAPTHVYSLSKSLTATVAGLLVQEGRLSPDDGVLERLGIDPASVEERWGRVRVRHCLSMTMGHAEESWVDVRLRAAGSCEPDPFLSAILSVPLDGEPGSLFAYDQSATYLVARVIEEVTGASVSDVLLERLLGPLGLPRVPWLTDPLGHTLGYAGARVPVGTVLAIAQLHLGGGMLGEQRFLDAHWVAEATRGQGPPRHDGVTDPDWVCGYGYSFWQARHGYRGDGAFGQFAVALPEQDTTVAITSETEDMQRVLDLLWEHVLPAVSEGARPDPAADAELKERLAVLALPPPASTGPAPVGPVSFRRGPGSTLPNAYAGLVVDRGPASASGPESGTAWVLRLDRVGGGVEVTAGDGWWASSRVAFGDGVLAVEAAAGWFDAGRFRAELRLVDSPHTVVIDGDTATGQARLAWRTMPLFGDDPGALVAE